MVIIDSDHIRKKEILMPGFVTHYIFGRETYRMLSSASQKENLYRHRAAYGLGLQGPDIFFYYLPSYVLHGHNIGALAHAEGTNAFFSGLLRSCMRFTSDEDCQIAEAYLEGFLGHYILDTICHPYIYAMTPYDRKANDYFSHHAYLETDIDTEFLDSKLHRQPRNFRQADTIALSHRQKKVIATMLHDAYRYAYPQLKLHKITMYLGIFSMQLGLRILRDGSGQKKVLFRFLERLFPGYPIFSPLIASDTLFFRTDPLNLRHADWTNPWDSSLHSSESFLELYDKSMQIYLDRLKKLYDVLHADRNSGNREQLAEEFLSGYGNRSFHSGLDCSIPT